MEVIVEDKQLSLAIGKKGQNVRLAAKLTGWKIDIKSEEEKRREVEKQFGDLEIGGAEAESPAATDDAGAEVQAATDDAGAEALAGTDAASAEVLEATDEAGAEAQGATDAIAEALEPHDAEPAPAEAEDVTRS